ncbi:MAG: thioredoxin domain-containing protein [Rhodospirillales bacterium]|jgi:hypothetical protein|nr:thioredoxin domain-containing protein [Rhodospirillales bacterium]MDP6645840.1 thioredoxin domain-containing protein [Rhodospirillales bacterium]MDP6843148.1 thioredoxin domain-containing protein [Rhodospirillales bacterium]
MGSLWAPDASAKNLLGRESSPYLKLHAKDPVHWRPWKPKYLDEAKRLDRPIFLSSGYLACHWCHVMGRESFADPAVAAVINADFYPILVDRDELPEVDALYQRAMAIAGNANGWPLTVFLTPDRKPFFGGGYFPPKREGGNPGFTEILELVSRLYKDRRGKVAADAASIVERLAKELAPRPGEVRLPHIDAAAKVFLTGIDPFSGGFRGAPKFPEVEALNLLWRAYIRSGQMKYRGAVHQALLHMSLGGMFDHVAGGFYRYTVDRQWRMPHFEKMLDVNGVLLRLAVEVWRETEDPILAQIIYRSVDFLLTEMALAEGGFAAALDADSLTPAGIEKEGAYYIWRKADLKSALGGQSVLFFESFALARQRKRHIDGDAEEGFLYRTGKHLAAGLDPLLATLKRIRDKRPRPRRDDTLLAGWNGLAVVALAEAGAAMDQPDWLMTAEAVFNRVLARLTDAKGRLFHSSAGGRLGRAALLEDHAMLADAALVLFELTGKQKYLHRAEGLARTVIARFGDRRAGGFFSSPKKARNLLINAKPITDNPNISANALMLRVLARLYYLTGENSWRQAARELVSTFGGVAADPSFEHAGFLNGAEDWLSALQVVIIGNRSDEDARSLTRRVLKTSLPTRIFQLIPAGTKLPETHPAQFKEQINGQATAYVCRGQICSLPATEDSQLSKTLKTFRRSVGR